jgi:hypothetical protein
MSPNLIKDIQVWWCTPAIPTLERLTEEDHEFKASLGYTGRSCLKI